MEVTFNREKACKAEEKIGKNLLLIPSSLLLPCIYMFSKSDNDH